jgi:hypothetical protein
MRSILIAICTLLSASVFSQELNAEVTVLFAPSLTVTTIDKEIVQELEVSIREFMNSTKWTNDKFDVEERVNCNIAITIQKITSGSSFEGEMQVQSTRPVYNTTYNTVLFMHNDQDCQFSYQRNAVLQYSENQFRDNLTSMLAYYAYMILGYDYDSFSLKGGDRSFAKAQAIVSNAQSAGQSGWKSSDTKGRKNRYYIIDNALQELFSPMRECYYDYHSKGMDKMTDNVDEARKEMLKALQLLLKVHSAKPGVINMSTFLNGKIAELVNLFSKAPASEKSQVVNLLKRLDPTNSSRYEKIMEAE